MSLTQNPHKHFISLFTAISIVVANMIGVGVFTSLGFQAADIKSGFALLFLWMLGGICALCGALSYGELGSVMPRSGGEFHYLSRIYHPAVGFLSGWVSVTVGFAAPIAAAAMALGKYLSEALPVSPSAIAITVVIVVSLVHTQTVKLGSYFQNTFTVLKITLIVTLVICGFLLATPQNLQLFPQVEDFKQVFSAPFAISLVYVMYSYSGWNASTYIASEVENPEKNVPRSLFIGTLIVLVLYLLLNFIFLYTTPLKDLAGKLEVGYLASSHIFGANGGKIVSLLISLGLISSISSMVWAGPRVTQVIGEDIPFFKLLARKNQNGIPILALLFQLSLVLFLVITSTFQTIITYMGFTLTLCSFLTVLGVFVHRLRYPEISRPYKTWGYPVTPLIFLGISLWMLTFIFKDKPMESLAGLGTIFLGLPVYFIASRQRLGSQISQDSTRK